MRKQLCLWLVGGAVVFAPALAHAEDEPKPYPECTKAPSDSETAAAKGAFQAGNASFDEADYPRALTYWEDAYRRDCTANALLKNLARAYELYGQKRQAVVALETFLVREPASSEKEPIQRRIEQLKKQIAAEKAAAPPTGTPPPTPPATGAQPAPPAGGLPPPPPPPPDAEPNGKRPIAPLIVAGGGGLLLIVGVLVYAPAAKDVSNFEAQCPNRTCDQAKHPNYQQLTNDANAARKKETTGGVLMGLGAVTVAGGLVWYFVSPRSGGSASASAGTLSKPHVDPAVAPGFAGIALSGAF